MVFRNSCVFLLRVGIPEQVGLWHVDRGAHQGAEYNMFSARLQSLKVHIASMHTRTYEHGAWIVLHLLACFLSLEYKVRVDPVDSTSSAEELNWQANTPFNAIQSCTDTRQRSA